MELIFGLGSTVFLLLLGLFAGGYAERKHLRSLDEREKLVSNMLVTDIRSFPSYIKISPGAHATLVTGEVAIASDYLKTFLASLKNLFGGELRSYLTLATRARREAILRMLEKAKDQGYTAVCNVRLDTSDIGGSSKSSQGIITVVVMASGTAYHHEGKGAYGEFDKSSPFGGDLA